MTDEERKKLCADLRIQAFDTGRGLYGNAADEIKRLAMKVDTLEKELERERKEKASASAVRQDYLDEIERLAKENTKLREEIEILWSALPDGIT